MGPKINPLGLKFGKTQADHSLWSWTTKMLFQDLQKGQNIWDYALEKRGLLVFTSYYPGFVLCNHQKLMSFSEGPSKQLVFFPLHEKV